MSRKLLIKLRMRCNEYKTEFINQIDGITIPIMYY
jgi:hypothetical protein